MDPIADYLTRLRNAGSAGHEDLIMPFSNAKVEISRILKEEGYINDFEIVDVSVLLHDAEELNEHLGDGSQDNLHKVRNAIECQWGTR